MDNIAISIMTALDGWGIPHQLITALISMIPLLELRGSILVAGLLKLPLIQTYIAAVIGNMIPIPFILIFIRKIFEWMKNSKIKWIATVPIKLENKVMKKSGQIEKYGYFGLFLFVAIPLPGTGAWTGTLAASFLNMGFKETTKAVILGVIIAGIIMAVASTGVFAIIGL